MRIMTSYKVKIKYYNHIFRDTMEQYRRAVQFFLEICDTQWQELSGLSGKSKNNQLEHLTIRTAKNPAPEYDFSQEFYKFPCYLRRAAIQEALGLYSAYREKLEAWEKDPAGRKPSLCQSGRMMPAMYRDNVYVRTGTYTAKVKVFIRNTWDWLAVELKKSDVDYISRHCAGRKECVPTLQKSGKQWFLAFGFQEEQKLHTTPAGKQRILSVDLGLNNACTVSAMDTDGTVTGRAFLSLPGEEDSLSHAVNRIKKAQQHGAYQTPRLWAAVKGINRHISEETAAFIVEKAVEFQVDTIVFEHLDAGGRKRGSKRQRIHLWRCQAVQAIVTGKAHRIGLRVSRVNAWGTSRLAYDGSGPVSRGREADLKSYSMCRFQSGKIYHCDLNAAYNIGARYFIRERIKSLPETARLAIEAKVPQCAKRSTCTLSTLLRLDAALAA